VISGRDIYTPSKALDSNEIREPSAVQALYARATTVDWDEEEERQKKKEELE